jgi:diguanylate cyclase (GGDEF)-like protein
MSDARVHIDAAEGSDSDPSPELARALSAYLGESVAVVDGEGIVTHLLGPRGGVLGLDHVVGRHIFEYCVPDDLPRALDLAVEALASKPGWTTTWQSRLRNGDVEGEFEIFIENRSDDPVISGFVVRLRPIRSSVTPISPNLAHELESLAGGVPLPIAFIGSDARLYYLNDALRDLVGKRAEEVARDGLPVLARGAERTALESAVADLLGHAGERTVLFALEGTDGAPTRMLEARFTGLGNGTQVLALFATLVDVTERHAAESELRRRVASDPLTGLLNRSSLLAGLAERIATDPEDVGVCYLDLDGFKLLNDTYGHQVGDDFLVDVGAILRRETSESDLVGRLGGDEFLVVVALRALGDPKEFDALAGRINDAIAHHGAAIDRRVTASVGTAVGRPGESSRELIRRADHAMYDVKRSRRARSGFGAVV